MRLWTFNEGGRFLTVTLVRWGFDWQLRVWVMGHALDLRSR